MSYKDAFKYIPKVVTKEIETGFIYSSTVAAANILTIGSKIIAGQDIVVSGNISIGGTCHSKELNITEVSNINNLIVSGNSLFTGKTTLNDIEFKGPVLIKEPLSISGITNIENTLNINGPTNIRNNLSLSGNALLKGGLNVSGATTLANALLITGATSIKNTLTVSKVAVSDTLSVAGETTINNILNVLGPTIINGGIIFNLVSADINNILTKPDTAFMGIVSDPDGPVGNKKMALVYRDIYNVIHYTYLANLF